MKNLKKVLSLVLVIAMAFSFVTIASAAKLDDYSDAASVTEKEAVDVLSQAGVLQGAGGAFSPTDTFTREQAAKVITYLMLGSKAADGLRTTKSSFSDVAPTRWSAPYIEYGVAAGVINGMGDGSFNPEGKVTGTQFAKMLLTALGYGKNGEYVGPNWEINTLKDAVTLEILDLDVDFTAPATREQVARYTLNSLLFTAQVWDKNKGEYVDSQSTGAVQFFARKLNLRCDPDIVGGVTGYTWYLNDNKIGFYADEKIIASDATGLGISMMIDKFGTWAMFFKAELDTAQGVQFYHNGAPIHVYNTTTDAGRTFAINELFVYNNLVYKVLSADTGANIIADMANIPTFSNTKVEEYAVAGAVVNFVNTDKDSKAETVSIIEKSVTIAEGAPVVSFGSVKIPGLSNPATLDGKFNEALVKYPADIQEDDYLLYYKDLGTGVTHVEKAQVVTGVATSSYYQGLDKMYNISGTGRKASALNGSIGSTGLDTFMATHYNVELTVILDNGGNIVDIDATENSAATAKYAVVLKAAPLSDAFASGAQAYLLFTDGTNKVVTLGTVNGVAAQSNDSSAVSNDGTENADLLEGKWVTYTVTSAGKYNLKTAPYTVSLGSGGVAIKRAAKFIDGNNSVAGDSTTVFLTPNGNTPDLYDYNVSTGIANAPATTNASAQNIEIVKFTATGTAKYVYIPTIGTLANPIQNVAYVMYDGVFVNYTIWPATEETPEYYEFKAIVDGQATTIKVDNSSGQGVALSLATGLVAYADNDGDGFIDTITTPSGKHVYTGSKKASGGIIRLGANGADAFTYNANTKVYYIDAMGNVTVKTVEDIRNDSDDIVTAYETQNTTDGDLLEAIYITVK